MTHFDDLSRFLKEGAPKIRKGPIALIFAEDEVELGTTIQHHLNAGFHHTIVFAVPEFSMADDLASQITRVNYSLATPDALETAVNGVIKAVGDVWIYYCFNAEYLFYPFSEHRTIGEVAAFCAEERRHSILTYVVDLYAGDLDQDPHAVNTQDSYIDKTGYYALARTDQWNNALDREQDFFGGLRWRFEEHIPVFNSDHTFNDPEYNTYASPWHNSLTGAVCSFRTAKALKRNPGSTFDIQTFKWHNSIQFEWKSQQLLDLGLMESGQWF